MSVSPRTLLVGLVVGLAFAIFTAKFVLVDPDEVLLVGDSILRQTGPALDDTFGRDVSVQNEAVNNSGLLTPAYVDWPAMVETLVAEDDPEVIVVLFIGNYTDTDLYVDEDGNQVAMNTPEFFRAWAKEADRLMEATEGSGADVYWVLPPPQFTEDNKVTTEGLRQVYADLAERWPEITLIDANDALATPDGSYLAQINGDDGQPVPIRVPDTVHLTDEGADRLADTIHAGIQPSL